MSSVKNDIQQTCRKLTFLPIWHRIYHVMGMRLASHGLQLSQAAALMRLYTHPEANEPTLLAEQLCLPPQTITFILDSLEQQGMAERKPHPTDRRRKVITITAIGAAKAKTILDDLFAFETAVSRATFKDDEAIKFRRTVECLADNVEKLNTSPLSEISND